MDKERNKGPEDSRAGDKSAEKFQRKPKADQEEIVPGKKVRRKGEDDLELKDDVDTTEEAETEEVTVATEEVAEKPAAAPAPRTGERKRHSFKRERDQGDSEFLEKVLAIKRVTKVTKGGKKLSFSALVVVGDTKGKVGYSLSKAGEVATAIRKALALAKKNMVAIPLKGKTIPHQIIGVCGGAEVLLKPASEGTGVIAAGPVRAICDGAGIHDILTKCHRSNNPINVVKATMDGLQRLKVQAVQTQG